MAGGSFGGGPPGSSLNSMQQSLFAQMDSMRRTSVGVQDIFSNQMFGMGPYGAGGQALGGAGDTLYRLNQTLEKLNQSVTRSPMMSGHAVLGGAGVSAGQMIAAGYFGAPVQMQGLPGGMLGGQVGRMMFAENVELGLERGARSGLTQMLPGLMGAGAALMPGGALLGPLVGAAAQAYAPMALRGLGLDAYLERGQMARQFRADIGSRLAGGSVGGRIAESLRVGHDLSGHMASYIRDQQKNYDVAGGFANFGLNAEEYAPLQQAMTSMMGAGDLKRLVSDGKNVIKEQMDALIEVSSTLNLTFKETAELAQQFGEVEGGAGALAGYVRQIESASQMAGIGLKRGMAAQFGLAMRAQARQLGLQGDISAGQAIQDVGVLQGMMSQTAGQRLLSYDQLAAFGGASEQERVQNMVQAMFQAGATIAQGPVGAMIRGNILAGNTTMQGGMLGMMGAAGAQFARDPFAYVISQADPQVNQQVQNRALFTHMDMLEEAFGGLDPQAASAAFIAKAGALGMSKTQAGAVLRFYQEQKSSALKIAAAGGPGMTVGRVMAAASGYAAATGVTQAWAMNKLASGDMTVGEAEIRAGGTFGFGDVSVSGFSQEEIDRAADEADQLARKAALGKLNVEDMKAGWNEGWMRRLGGRAAEYYGIIKRAYFGDRSADEAGIKAAAAVRAQLEQANQLSFTSSAGLAFAQQHRTMLEAAGVSFTSTGALTADSFSKFSLEGFGRGKAIGDMVRALASGGDFGSAARTLQKEDAAGFQALLSTIGAMSASERGKQAVADYDLAGALSDSVLTAEEFGQEGMADKLAKFMKSMGKSSASFLAFNALKPMITDAAVMQTLMNKNNELLEAIKQNTASK